MASTIKVASIVYEREIGVSPPEETRVSVFRHAICLVIYQKFRGGEKRLTLFWFAPRRILGSKETSKFHIYIFSGNISAGKTISVAIVANYSS